MSENEIDIPLEQDLSENKRNENDYRNQGMAFGLMFGSIMTLAMILFGHAVFGMFFIPIGMSLGMSIGLSIKRDK